MRNARNTRRRSVNLGLPAALLALLIAVFAAGCGSSSSSTSSAPAPLGGGKLDVVGYSTPEAVYTGTLEPDFEATPEGEGVSFSNSFGASGDQSRAVVAGQPAAVVHFSQAGDMERLVEEGEIVAKDWDKRTYKGIAADSVVVMIVRSGNPKGLKSLADLQTKDVDVVTPNPFSSGSARWNIMAIYGAAINAGKSPDQALAEVKTVLEKTVAQPGSGRDALATFTQGEGRRAPQLRERGDQGDRRGRRRRIRHPALDAPDRNPDRGHQRRTGARGRRFPQLHLVRCGPGNLGRERLPPGQPGAGRRETVPDP